VNLIVGGELHHARDQAVALPDWERRIRRRRPPPLLLPFQLFLADPRGFLFGGFVVVLFQLAQPRAFFFIKNCIG
jgi:hypothetical protein